MPSWPVLDWGRIAAAREGLWKLLLSCTQQVHGRASSPERGACCSSRSPWGLGVYKEQGEAQLSASPSEVLPCLASNSQRRHPGGCFWDCTVADSCCPGSLNLLLHPHGTSVLTGVNHWAGWKRVYYLHQPAELWAGAPLLLTTGAELTPPPNLGCHQT